MADYFWSSNIQGILTLDLSRDIRFRDDRSELLLNLLGLKPGMKVAEIGCGPGALSRKLAKWLGETSNIIGVDRDTLFIEYAREKAKSLGILNVDYIEGDALKLPLLDASVDACTSHTVLEHLPNREFLIEQKRICKKGGVVSVMMRKPKHDIITNPSGSPNVSKREEELWKLISYACKEYEGRNKIKVCQYEADLAKLPLLFEEIGFSDVIVDGIVMPIAIDDARNSNEVKRAIIDSDKLSQLEGISMAQQSQLVSDEVVEELKVLIDERFEKRISLMESGEKIWDYQLPTIIIIRGRV